MGLIRICAIVLQRKFGISRIEEARRRIDENAASDALKILSMLKSSPWEAAASRQLLGGSATSAGRHSLSIVVSPARCPARTAQSSSNGPVNSRIVPVEKTPVVR